MKKLFIVIISLLSIVPLELSAQFILTVHQNDGKQFSFGFEEKPIVTFNNNILVFTTTNTVLHYEFTSIKKITFDGEETLVNEIKDDVSKPSISLKEYSVSISGIKNDAVVYLIAVDGKILQSYKANKDGIVLFGIEELPIGTYIISSENLAVKILKK